MEIGFDIISDLHLNPDDSFNWENKATSLYCLIAGNVSAHHRTLLLTLTHLSKFYHGVFFIPGPFDVKDKDYDTYCNLLNTATQQINNVSILYHNVIVLNGIGIIGVNGWIGDIFDYEDSKAGELAVNDLLYLKETIVKLTRHLDIKKIIIISSTIPNKAMYFGQEPEIVNHQLPLQTALSYDSQFKVTNWIFGNSNKNVDTHVEGVHYISNPYLKRRPYYAKRIDVSI